MAQVSMNEDSPYVAKDGAVSELGQPTSQHDSAAVVGTQRAQAEQQAPAPQAQQQHPPPTYEAPPAAATAAGGDQVSDRGLHLGGRKEPTSQADPNSGTEHGPLEGTQDVNIGYGQPPFEQKRTGGVVGKIKECITGQKPGQGAATGNATAGSFVPGEEDYAGKTGHQSGWPQPVAPPGMATGTGAAGHHGYDEKPTGAQHGYVGENAPPVAQHGYGGENAPPVAQHGYGGVATQHGYDKPQDGYEARPGAELASSAVSGYGDKPLAPQHGYDQPQHGYGGRPEAGGYGDKPLAPQHGYDGTEGYGDKPPAAQHSYHKPQHGYVGAEGYGDKPAESYGYNKPQGTYDGAEGYGDKPAEHHGYDEKPAAGYGYHGSGAPEDKYTTPVQTEEKYTSSVPTTGSSTVSPHSQAPISTPAEPEARHDVPSATNAPGAEYTDPQGNVHPEGPRDDNVKKEGIMSKLMDKLHISGKKHKNNKHGAEPTTL